MYIMQCKLPLERRQRFMTRATEYSSVKSVSSSLFSQAQTSQLIIPPAMRADYIEHLRRKSAGTCMYMYPYVWMYIRSRIPIRIAKAMQKSKREPEAELLLCGEDVLACKRVDRIDERRLRRRAHSGRPRWAMCNQLDFR